MNIRTIFLCFWLICSSGWAGAQGFFKTYMPVSSSLRSTFQTSDGGYLSAGNVAADTSLLLLRTDAAGTLSWSKQIQQQSARAIAADITADEGIVLLTEGFTGSGGQKNAVFRFDNQGNLMWHLVVENNIIPNGLRDITALPDGGFAAAGNTYDGNFTPRNWLVRLDATGHLLWQKYFGTQVNVRRILSLNNGDMVVSGHGADLQLMRLDPNGSLLWQQQYLIPGNQTSADLILTRDDNLALLGTSPYLANSGEAVMGIGILKVDLNGVQLWFKRHYPYTPPALNGTGLLPVVNSFAQDNDGNYYIPYWGFLDDPFDSEIELLKLDPQGDALNKYQLGVLGNAWQVIADQDERFVIAGDNNGFTKNALLLRVDKEGQFQSNVITGSLFRDDNENCIRDAGEPGMPNFMVSAENQLGQSFYKKVGPDGQYSIRVSEGNFELNFRPVYGPENAYNTCNIPVVGLAGTAQSASAEAAGVRVVSACPLLEIGLSGGLLRRCEQTTYTMEWYNAGNEAATDARIELDAAAALAYLSSTLPLSGQNGSVYTFELGTIPAGASGLLRVTFEVPCDAVTLGEVICVEAHIYPDSSCLPPDTNWDGSKIAVSGVCNGDEIEFTIKNVGSGNMTQTLDYVIIEDHIIFMQAPIPQLNAGDEIKTVRNVVPGDSCFALRVFPNQVSILEEPIAIVETCSGEGNAFLYLELPDNDHLRANSRYCDEVIGSFDPNDKTAFPRGMWPAHYIEPDEDITYLVRFQNTGTDTAFFVLIRDTLAPTLNPATLRPIGSSHNYEWDVTDEGVVSFYFPRIMLPDSNVNEPLSHGYIAFKVGQMPHLPDGTHVDNTAHIYFDYNDAVVTNTWRHTIGRPAVTAVQQPTLGQVAVGITPNPMLDQTVFTVPENGAMPVSFQLYNAAGKLMRTQLFDDKQLIFKRNNLPSGMYFWQIHSSAGLLASGRLMAE